MRLELDLKEEIREEAKVQLTKYKGKIAQYHNINFKLWQFKERDLILKKLKAIGKVEAMGKLRPNWKGPFKVVKVLQHGSYHLKG